MEPNSSGFGTQFFPKELFFSYCANPPAPSFWVFKQVCSQTSVTTVNQDPEHNVWFSSRWTERNHAKLLQKKTKENWFHLRSLIPILRRVIFFYFQNEKDQILTTNIWLNLVSTFFSLSRILGLNVFNEHCSMNNAHLIHWWPIVLPLLKINIYTMYIIHSELTIAGRRNE